MSIPTPPGQADLPTLVKSARDTSLMLDAFVELKRHGARDQLISYAIATNDPAQAQALAAFVKDLRGRS